MFKPFVVNGTITRRDVIVALIMHFYQTLFGFTLLLLALCVFVLWTLTSFEDKPDFIILILLILSPWLYLVISSMIKSHGYRPSNRKIEFTSDYIKINTKEEGIMFGWEIFRNTIKSVIYIRSFIFIIDEQKRCVIINSKTLSEDERTKITDYLNISQELYRKRV